jgi:hypothetical protein
MRVEWHVRERHFPPPLGERERDAQSNFSLAFFCAHILPVTLLFVFIIPYLLLLYSTVTEVVMPPRALNLPVTFILRGSQAATRSSVIALMAAS